jgi:ER membrane protein complex subunit 7
VLDVYSETYHFPSMKLKVIAENSTVNVLEFKYPGAKKLHAQYPIVFRALTRIQYDLPPPVFSIVGMLMANPMILMMLFSAVMVIAMPILMKNMTPEELAEIQKSSFAAQGDPMQKLSKLMGGGAKTEDDED